jgi:single-stranded DNA-binding protein
MPLRFREPAVLATDPKLTRAGDEDVCELFVFIKDLQRTPGGYTDKPIAYKCWGAAGRAAADKLGKGSTVLLDGQLHYREYDKDGHTVGVWYGTGRVDFLRIKRNGQYVDANANGNAADTRTAEERKADQDIPF